MRRRVIPGRGLGPGWAGRGRGALVALGLGLLAGCVPTPPPQAAIEPAYVFSLGVAYADVVAMLGPPDSPPRYDRYSDTSEAVYRFPFDAVEVDSRFPNGAVRREHTNHIHMFFDRAGALVQLAIRPNRYYPSMTDFPVQRVTIAPRLVRRTGSGVTVAPPPPPPPPPSAFPWGGGAPGGGMEPEGDR